MPKFTLDSYVPLLEVDACQDNWLVCPFCGDVYTHITEVTLGFRGKEDGPSATVTVNAMTATMSPPTSPAKIEFSSRRQWIEIHIDCENCPGGTLVLAQHKGVTETKLIGNAVQDNRNTMGIHG